MLKAMRITPASYPKYQQAAALLGFTAIKLMTANGLFVVIKEGRRRVEYYDEKDFRKNFEWIEKPVKDGKPVYKFLPVKRIKNDEDE